MPRLSTSKEEPKDRIRRFKARDKSKAYQIREVMTRTTTYADNHTYGRPLSISPHSALLEEIHRTAGHVAWLGQVVAELEKEDIVKGIEKEVQVDRGIGDGETSSEIRTEVSAGANVWVKLYQVEREQLRRVCETAIRAGIEERYVQLEEQRARVVAEVIKNTVLELGHSMQDENVRKIVRNNIMQLTMGAPVQQES